MSFWHPFLRLGVTPNHIPLKCRCLINIGNRIRHLYPKIDVVNLVNYLNRTPIFEWYVVMCGPKNKYQTCVMCLKEIEQQACSKCDMRSKFDSQCEWGGGGC